MNQDRLAMPDLTAATWRVSSHSGGHGGRSSAGWPEPGRKRDSAGAAPLPCALIRTSAASHQVGVCKESSH